MRGRPEPIGFGTPTERVASSYTRVMKLAEIPEGVVRLTDARRGTEREVALRSFRLSTMTVSAFEFEAGRAVKDGTEHDLVPAVGVTWLAALAWCNSASDHEGLPSAYSIDGDVVSWNPAVDGYRLPTEAEWVFGAMGGVAGARYGALPKIAWTVEDTLIGAQSAGRKDANKYGLFDTLGNVWEWCWDRLDPARYGDYRVLKGGGWADPEWSCRVGVRRGNAPDARVEDVGFRVARGAATAVGHSDEGQGRSEEADRQRASVRGPLPVGWTPLT